MERTIFFEDIVSIALLYIYGQSGSVILSYDKAVEYFKRVKSSLEARGVIAEYKTTQNKSEYYYIGKDELGNRYCIVSPGCDLSIIVSSGRITPDVMLASQNNSALEVIGLEVKDGHIVKKDQSLKRSLY